MNRNQIICLPYRPRAKGAMKNYGTDGILLTSAMPFDEILVLPTEENDKMPIHEAVKTEAIEQMTRLKTGWFVWPVLGITLILQCNRRGKAAACNRLKWIHNPEGNSSQELPTWNCDCLPWHRRDKNAPW